MRTISRILILITAFCYTRRTVTGLPAIRPNANTWNGITLSASNDNLIDGNRAISNTYAIVVSESSGNKIVDNTTRRRIYLLLPVFLVYFAIMLYLIERKAFIFYYHWKYKDRGRMHGLR